MHIFHVSIPDRPLTNIELSPYAREIEIPHLRCFYERYITTVSPFNIECGVANLNASDQSGSHWMSYYRNGTDIFYFNS